MRTTPADPIEDGQREQKTGSVRGESVTSVKTRKVHVSVTKYRVSLRSPK
jgi:hypothetical protein